VPPPSRIPSLLHESAVTFAGTGARQVDMNQYNVPLEEAVKEWTANLVPKTPDTEEGVYLGVANGRELFPDILKINLKRRKGAGLGIQLPEIAGGREAGLGITLVAGLVEGGIAEGSDILEGDSITRVAVQRSSQQKQQGSGIAEMEQVISVRTECLGYDATVEAIQSLPEPMTEDETIVLTVKRVRRKPQIKVRLEYPPDQNEEPTTITLFAGENLRLGMLVRGIKLNDPLAKRFDTKSGGNCGAGGLCRTCVVKVMDGMDVLNPQKLPEKQMLEDSPRWRLACKAFVGYGMREGELMVQVNPRQW
ncbi:MAG: 2Fe-2S iron-sulfur cluster-binding protein, partial [Myxococcota bacterium]